ncbi:MAG: glucosamine-6-phosphate deaminase [Nocardioides sp.]|uniref:glucosamine-6-phosphate deaminase n=1 Tax=Nocardioides sp. TaxID=35761 RepID=UPI003D6BC5BD
MEVVILPDAAAIGVAAADLVEDLLRDRPDAVLGLATGSSPLPTYDELAGRCAHGRVSFARARAFTLDEYVGLPPEHPAAYARVIRDELADRVDFGAEAVVGPRGDADDVVTECARYDAAIREAGGIDLQILGIGTDGHVAFNEPGSSLASRTRVKTLTEQTRADNARFFGGDRSAVPRHCITQGLGTIMEARHLLLVATGAGKAEAVHQMVEGAVSARWPASILQLHPTVTAFIDEEAASRLELGDYYRFVQRHKGGVNALVGSDPLP